VDKSEYVRSQSLSINRTLTSYASAASFDLENPDTAPAEGNDVRIYENTSDNVIFAGVIYAIRLMYPATGHPKYFVQCSDYTRLLDRRLVPEKYLSGTAMDTVIKDIITKYTSGFTSNNVLASNPLIGDVIFNYRTPSDCIRELIDKHAPLAQWYVDHNKDVHVFYQTDQAAPYSINDDTLQYMFNRFSIGCDYSQVRNLVMVQGGKNLSTATNISWKADGTERTWTLPYYPHELTLTVDGVPKTLGEEHTDPDDGTYEYFYNYFEKLIKCAAAETTPPADTVMIANMKYEVPILVRVGEPASVARIAAAEGGDGTYEYVVRDTSLNSLDMCRAAAMRELKNNAWPKVSGSVITHQSGFNIGQALTVNMTGCAYNGTYTIQTLRIESAGNNILRYTLEFEGNLN
jgi:hypothetical protein